MYMVFVEVDRKDGMLEELKEYILDIENIIRSNEMASKILCQMIHLQLQIPELKEYVIQI